MAVLHLRNLEDTIYHGEKLGAVLFPGAVVALSGPMGAGKTHLVQAIAAGLGVENSLLVNSPTFVLIHEYPARVPIYHMDAYRLNTAAEFAELGLAEYLSGDGVCLIEWADKFPDLLPTACLSIQILITAECERVWHIHASGPEHQTCLRAWLDS